MERIEQLMYFYNMLKDLPWQDPGGCEAVDIALYEKRLYVLTGLLYGNKMRGKVAPYYVGKTGHIYSDYGIVDCDDGLFEECIAFQSKVTDYLLIYYNDSPFWEIHYESLYFDECDRESEMDLIEFFKRKEGIFEKRLLSTLEVCAEDHPLKEFHSFYCDSDDCAADDCVILVSKLMPYFRRAEDSMKDEDKEMSAMVNQMEKVLTKWLSGYTFSITGIEYESSYYFSCDDSSNWSQYGYGYGVLNHRLEILVAGEILDRCILKLDEKYAFLPSHMRDMSIRKE